MSMSQTLIPSLQKRGNKPKSSKDWDIAYRKQEADAKQRQKKKKQSVSTFLTEKRKQKPKKLAD